MTRKAKTIVLDGAEEIGPDWDWMPKNLVDLISWVETYLKLVPEDYRDSAAFETIGFQDSRRNNRLHVKVHFQRPETDEEMNARLEDEEAEKLEQQKAERQMLEELKAKFDDR